MWSAIKIGKNWFAHYKWFDDGHLKWSDTGPFSSLRDVSDFIFNIRKV